MEEFRGKFNERLGHPDIVVSVKPTYRPHAESILGYFEEQIRSGVRFQSDETVQIGWASVLLTAIKGGALEILEPDFGSMPIKWVRGANNTFRHLILQKEVCRQIGVELNAPSMMQSGVISPDFLKSDAQFYMSRDEPRGTDSGWLFREQGYDGVDGALCSLYQIAISVPAVIPFLSLPSDSIVRRNSSGLKISTGRTTISGAENDFLQRLMGSSYLS